MTDESSPPELSAHEFYMYTDYLLKRGPEAACASLIAFLKHKELYREFDQWEYDTYIKQLEDQSRG